MTAPNHHPDESLLLDFGFGSLAQCPRLVVSGHLSVCATCRRAVADVEEIGGALLNTVAPALMRPDALDLALARIERPAGRMAATPERRAGWIAAPPEAIEAARTRRRWGAPGVWVAPVARGPGKARSYLLGVAAGMSMPLHTHRGSEMVCVLAGSYRDGDTVHSPGDFACSDDAIEHQPQITGDRECVCLVATENALVPRNWVGRLFQPIVGI